MGRNFILTLLVAISIPLCALPQNNNIILEQKVAEQSEQIDGMRSVIDGLNSKITQISAEHETLKEDSERNKELLFELRERIDKINQNYATKSDIEKSAKQSSVQKIEKVKKEEKSEEKTKEEYYKEAVSLYKAKKYAEAKVNFKHCIVAKYNEASSFYYLGESAYYLKSYNEAVVYYKKSAGLNEKASYMDVLLLHTAISLENTNELKQAKLFYNTLIEKYPTSTSAEIAKKKLATLKAS